MPVGLMQTAAPRPAFLTFCFLNRVTRILIARSPDRHFRERPPGCTRMTPVSDTQARTNFEPGAGLDPASAGVLTPAVAMRTNESSSAVRRPSESTRRT